MKKIKENKIIKKIISKPIIIIIIVVIIISGIGISYALPLLNSSDVGYDNTESELQSTDVQGAIDELYQHATDYTEIKGIVGNDTLTTTDQTLTGGINEINSKLNIWNLYPIFQPLTEDIILDD